MIWREIYIGITEYAQNIINNIDNNNICAIICRMEKDFRFSSCEKFRAHPKHMSLTHYMRKYWSKHPEYIENIVTRCDVSPFVGELPPQLRMRVPKKLLARRTMEFHDILDAFVVDNWRKIENAWRPRRIPLPAATKLFGTECKVECRHIEYNSDSFFGQWRGASGIVCRLYFPRINAEYALKIFRTIPKSEFLHGAAWEIPTAFNAYHAEPRNNTQVYMASLIGRGYMLSKWNEDLSPAQSKFCKHNENKIFYTKSDEHAPRNYACGLRIDYGKTYQTAYGAMPYPLRKLYRKIKNAAMCGDVAEIKSMFNAANTAAERQNLNRVMDTLSIDTYRDGKKQIQKIINRDWSR